MNMNKALQNLYHAVSGSTTTKVNISKLLVDIHYAITGVESSVKNNWSRIIDSMATNWPEGGGGSSDNMAILPKLTVTLNIDNTEHIDTYGLTDAVELNNGIVTQATFNSPQTSQVWESYIIPLSMDNQIFWNPAIMLYDESYTGYYAFTISNTVNCAEDPTNPGNGAIAITDPTKPASCTVNAVYTSY